MVIQCTDVSASAIAGTWRDVAFPVLRLGRESFSASCHGASLNIQLAGARLGTQYVRLRRPNQIGVTLPLAHPAGSYARNKRGGRIANLLGKALGASATQGVWVRGRERIRF